MSRRAPNPAAERAAQNQQTLKSLLKLEPNKVCADCKKNKHPRWASWNLGIFICIRCSGIHRSMGTHISRVKSVDLDSWTDEQMHSIMSWGNARANKYWEAKLAPGHVPSESKIENFIRTKYELKRWVMDGPIPDPSTLNADADDDIPLSLVKEKQTIERKESVRKSSVGRTAAPRGHAKAAAAPAAPVIDLFGDDSGPPRASSAGPATTQVASKSAPAPPKTTSNTKDSLLGLDFLGSQPSAPARPSSTTGSSGAGQSRPDLKQSILSLYATAPRTQPAAQPGTQAGGGFGGLGSPTLSQTSTGSGANSGGFVDAFSSLSFNTTAPAASTSPKPVDVFSSLSFSSSTSTARQAAPAAAAPSSGFGGLGGGGFFDTKPAAAPAPAPVQAKPTASSSFGGLGGFGDFSSPTPAATAAAPATSSSSNAFGDLFDFTSPAPTTTTSAPALQPNNTNPPPGASSSMNSVFNLSSPPAKAAPTTATSQTNPLASVTANWSNADVWGNEGWGATETAAAPTAPVVAAAAATIPSISSSALKSPGLTSTSTTTNDFGWGSTSGSFASQSIVPGSGGGFSPQPKVAEDEEFGGWASSTAATAGSTTTTSNGNAKPAAGFGGANEDLFSNVWG